jgi:hypothetical protein
MIVPIARPESTGVLIKKKGPANRAFLIQPGLIQFPAERKHIRGRRQQFPGGDF